MKLSAAASALAVAAALAASPPALAAGPGTGNPSNGGSQGAANQSGSGPNAGPAKGDSTATAAGSASTAATTNPGALGTAPNPGPGTSPGAPNQGSAANPAAGMNGVTAPGSTTQAAGQNATPSQRNPVLTKGGRVRASRVIGSAVYDGHDQKIGTIDDILLGTGDQQAGDQQAGDQQAGDQQTGDQHGATAVISVGGFLGIGSKLVAVPYSKLQFGNTNKNSDNRVVMPDATKAALNGMPSYHYLPGKA